MELLMRAEERLALACDQQQPSEGGRVLASDEIVAIFVTLACFCKVGSFLANI
jgi:hypothetical protein